MLPIINYKKYLLNKVTLDRNTNKTRLCIDWLTKMLSTEVSGNLLLYFPEEQWLRVHSLSVYSYFIEYNYIEK